MDYGQEQAMWKAIGAIETHNDELEAQNEQLSGQVEVLCEIKRADRKAIGRLAFLVGIVIGVNILVLVFNLLLLSGTERGSMEPQPPSTTWDQQMASISAWCVRNGYVLHVPIRSAPWFEKKRDQRNEQSQDRSAGVGGLRNGYRVSDRGCVS